jgi:hypothetical protein
MPICHFVGKIMDVYLREYHMVSMDGNPVLSFREVVDIESSGNNPSPPSNLCHVCGYYLPFGV